MTPWEYRLVEVFVRADLGERQLTSYGSDGWEAVGMHVHRDEHVMVILMKRPQVQDAGAAISPDGGLRLTR